MQIVIIHDLQLVTGFLSYQMSSVTCCIDQDIVRLLLQTTLDHCLQIFIFDFKFLEWQIIHIDNEFIVSVLDLGDHIIQILKLMLIHLDNTKSLIIITVQDSLDTWGFTCTRITKKQTVVCLSASYESFCILDQFLLRDFISDQVFQFHMSDPCDRLDLHIIILIMAYTKSLM